MSLTNSLNSLPVSDTDLQLSAYDYELSERHIAQQPASPRDSSRLLVVETPTKHSHHIFRELPKLLRPEDVLVLNNTRVIPARLIGVKPSGRAVEVLLVEELERNRWLALVKPGRRLKPGATIKFPLPADDESEFLQKDSLQDDGLGNVHSQPERKTSFTEAELKQSVIATILQTDESINGRIIDFQVPQGRDLWDVLPLLGNVPLPPYVTNTQIESDRYQTVYSEQLGAIAAPTAGLHFTPTLLAQLEQSGIDHCFITLHVGVGTFRPVEAEDITTHEMHHEWIDVPEETVERIRIAKKNGGRIIAVGTTVIRSLEAAAQTGSLKPYRGKTDLFIYPGYEWQVVEGLITNFHLPKSSLLMLVSALIGRPRLLSLYQEAIDYGYRFYSFGDAMLILPEAKCSI